eukprot:scpid66207/ scgid1461/ 
MDARGNSRQRVVLEPARHHPSLVRTSCIMDCLQKRASAVSPQRSCTVMFHWSAPAQRETSGFHGRSSVLVGRVDLHILSWDLAAVAHQPASWEAQLKQAEITRVLMARALQKPPPLHQYDQFSSMDACGLDGTVLTSFLEATHMIIATANKRQRDARVTECFLGTMVCHHYFGQSAVSAMYPYHTQCTSHVVN